MKAMITNVATLALRDRERIAVANTARTNPMPRVEPQLNPAPEGLKPLCFEDGALIGEAKQVKGKALDMKLAMNQNDLS